MEVAGQSAAEHIWSDARQGHQGLFLCGKGNNGGDALVVARYLIQKGVAAVVVFVSGRDDLSPLAQKNTELLHKIEQHDNQVKIKFVDSWDEFDQSLQPDFVVDGMLGTGLNSNLRGDIEKAVQWTNQQTVSCYAMDISTGLHADTGQAMGKAIQADTTFSFGTLKQGFYLNDGFKCRGNVQFCELPFPDHLKESGTYLMDDAWIAPLNQQPAAHKYQAGVVYVIAGSEGLTGAAMMSAKSAWAAGAGAVILICPHGLLSIYESNLPQIIKKPVGEKNETFFKEKHLSEVLPITQQKEGTVLLGPGLGRREATVRFVRAFTQQNKKHCVIDADGLWALAQAEKWPLNDEADYMLTPHPGEFKMLLDKPFDDDFERLQQIKKIILQKEVALLSKGFPVIHGTKNGKIYLTGYDNRHFSRAGFGDVLAGKVTAYRSLGCAFDEAAVRALLTGKKRIEQLRRQQPGHKPEPKDFL